MKNGSFRYFTVLVAFALLAFAGCSSGGGGNVTTSEKGTSLTVSGQVGEKSLAKSVFAATDPLSGTVSVLDAASATVLASTSVNSDGSFGGLTFTLPSTKSILVFKAEVNKTGSPFYTIVPIDLSNPPAPGIGASNAINILITQASTNIAATVSSMLGLSGKLGDTGNAIPAGQTYTSVAQLVTQYGGQVLAYNTSGLSLTGSLNESLLPAQDANSLTGDQINSIVLDGAVTGVAIPGNNPIISFKVINKASGKGISGLKAFAFAVAQLNPGVSGGPDEWLSYMVASATSRPSYESVTNTSIPTGAALIDNGDGSYVYKMAKDVKTETAHPGVTYDANLTHRVVVQVRTAPVAGTTSSGAAISNFFNPANLFYDFVPASGAPVTGMLQREIVITAACNECHSKIGTTTPHGGRVDTRFCVVCHTKQRANGRDASTESPVGTFNGPVATSGSQAGKVVTYIVDGRAIGNFVNLVHKIHMGKKLTKQGYNFAGVLFNEVAYPQEITNCRKCHKAGAGAQGDNWQTRPSRLACGACHDNIDFATGANLKTGGTPHVAQADDANCATCHSVTSTILAPAVVHTLPSTSDANQRTMSATITGVVVDANGGVTVTFTLTDNGVPVTERAKFSNPEFSLAKLVPGVGGASSDWVSYTSRFRTKDAAVAPVLQGYNESNGTVTDLGGGTWSYKFKLITAEPEGDIRNVTHAHNVSTVAGPYNSANWTTGDNVVTYEPTLTHRVAMIFQKVGTPNIDNATNAYFDFVPSGAAVTETRNIVTMNNCAVCHAGIKRHKGYATELCVTCHNQGTADPYSGETVDLQRFIHKLHMGKNLPSVIAGGTFMINGENYGELLFPGIITNCGVCHVEGTGAPANAANWRNNPTKRACGTCHDSTMALAHINANIDSNGIQTCVVCHGAGRVADIKVVHRP